MNEPKYIMVASCGYGCECGCVGSNIEILDENKKFIIGGHKYFEFDAYYSDEGDKISFIKSRLERHFEKYPQHKNLEIIYDEDEIWEG